jgi:hypothetical protein
MRGFLRIPLILALAFSLPAGAETEKEAGGDFRRIDLSGEWYVLIHFKDKQSEDKSITKFKDFAWSVKQSDKWIEWEKYPYVLFSEGVEVIRRHAMTEHLPWEPEELTWQSIREAVGVSSRAMSKKRLEGSVEEGFRSAPAAGAGGANVITFSRNWDVTFEKSRIRIQIIDSLSGSSGLAGMDEATVFEIDQAVGAGELRGKWLEGTKYGTFRMVRAQGRKVLK